jgi:hypothetical protein
VGRARTGAECLTCPFFTTAGLVLWIYGLGLYVCARMYVYVYVCMHACMCVCTRMHACMYVCMHACMYVCMYTYACMYVCMYACMYMCMHGLGFTLVFRL